MKRRCTAAEAVSEIEDGATVLIGGFGGAGAPVELIHALIDHGARDLVVVNNNAGTGNVGLAALIRQKRVRKLICSFPRSSDPRAFQDLYAKGEIELELVPQGTLAERLRAGGAGVRAFFTKTSIGTQLAEGKDIRLFDGVPHVMESWLRGDFALVKAQRADAIGNLVYNKSARNFGPVMCTAATRAIAQVSMVVPAGAIDAEVVVTPGIFVQTLVEVPDPVQEETLIRQKVNYP